MIEIMENLGDLGSAHCVSLLQRKKKVKIPRRAELRILSARYKGGRNTTVSAISCGISATVQWCYVQDLLAWLKKLSRELQWNSEILQLPIRILHLLRLPCRRRPLPLRRNPAAASAPSWPSPTDQPTDLEVALEAVQPHDLMFKECCFVLSHCQFTFSSFLDHLFAL